MERHSVRYASLDSTQDGSPRGSRVHPTEPAHPPPRSSKATSDFAHPSGSSFKVHETDHFNTTPTGAEFFFTRCHD
jgi:hypothetical protein